jgi:DNA (cytosine-5)-methyltransferase 1
MSAAPTFGSLFSGIGGIDLGFERAGFVCRWQVEINEYCRRVLAKHWPNVKRYGDIRELFIHELEAVDVVAGGFPCKNTSNAAAIHGRRTGLSGPESRLWSEQYHIIVALHPEWAVVENVLGVSTWAQTIKANLERVGYTVSRLQASARGVGAPHLRRRVFFIANRDGKRLEESGACGPSPAEYFERGAPDGDAWLSTLPGVLRVDDGVPGGLHRRERIECLGNAVVPDCAEWIGRRIAVAMGRRTS